MFSGILRTLTYGQRLQIAEGNIAVPMNREDIETWVTRSEEMNEKAGKPRVKPKAVSENSIAIKPVKGDQNMASPSQTSADCHEKDHGYFCFTPKPIPQCSTFFSFNSCCCEDGTGGLLEALYQFALTKKAANPAILRVIKKYSPNTACSTLHLDFLLTGNATQTLADTQSIAEYYLVLLGY